MWSIILTVIIGVLILLYVAWVIYKSVKRAIEGKSCCGCSENCEDKCKRR